MHLLSVDDLTETQILEIFTLAKDLKSHQSTGILNGKTFALFFPESSVRTRITFEKGVRDLGGNSILFPPQTLDKRETPRDVVQYIENWADGMVIRHPSFQKLQELSKYASIPIINAMTSYNHPCEILSDLFSISEEKRNYRDLVYTFVGGPGNIVRSWMAIAKVMDLEFNHVCVSGFELSQDTPNYKFHTDLESALMRSDVILTDSLPDELRTDEYVGKYQITLERMRLSKQYSILNPCPPFFRGEEVSDDAIASDYFVGYGFKKNLLYLQQAIILYCSGISLRS